MTDFWHTVSLENKLSTRAGVCLGPKVVVETSLYMGLLPDSKIAGCACAGNAGNVLPHRQIKGNHKLATPACITARAWCTCRDACQDRLPAVAGQTFPSFPAHAHPQFYLSGKRPMTEACSTYQFHCLVSSWPGLRSLNTKVVCFISFIGLYPLV